VFVSDHSMKRVLLINEGGASNLGDEAIRFSLDTLLRDAGCEVEWTRFAGWRKRRDVSQVGEERLRRASWWKKLAKSMIPVKLRWFLRTWPTFLGYLKSNDYELVLIGGGQLIQSNEFFGLAMFLWIYIFKKLRKKKVVLVGVGAASRYSCLDTYLYRRSLKLVDSIYVRDKTSLDILRNTFDISAQLIPDVAFYLSAIYKYPNEREKRSLICPVDFEFHRARLRDQQDTLNEDEYLGYWEDIAVGYSDSGYDVELFCTSKRPDLATVEKLKDRLDIRGVKSNILDISTLESLTREIAKSEVVVSGRMHALVIGYCYGCKVVPYITSAKIKAFEDEYLASSLGLEEIQDEILSRIKEIVGT